MKMKKVKITVAGITYTIATDDDPGYALMLAEKIDGKIQGIMEKSGRISPTQATLLTLLEYADTIEKNEKEAEKMRDQLKECLADAAQAKSERDFLKREMAKQKKINK